MGGSVVVARAAPHHWEEPVISGARGSGVVFFSGCPLGCVYCQNETISRDLLGKEMDSRALRYAIDRLVEQGVHNVNLITAGHVVEPVLAALNPPLPVPVVWNSSGYELPATLEMLRGSVQVFLPDYKYALSEPAALYSRAADYPEVVIQAIEAMLDIAGPPRFDREGMLCGGVLVRHLVLPGHLDNTRAVIDSFAQRFRDRALFSLMGQYVPIAHAPARIARRLTRREYSRMVDYMLSQGIEQGYIQQAGADDARYTPPFDLTGL